MENLATSRARASRYARALFEVALVEADPREVERELADFAGLFEQYAPLRRALWSMSVPVARKQAVVAALIERARYARPLEKLIGLVAQRDQLSLLPHLLDAYRRRLMDHLGIVQAQVKTATAQPPERLQAIQQALSHATGKQVTMTTQVDPALIGGIVATVQSTVYDGSVSRQLQRIKETIESA